MREYDKKCGPSSHSKQSLQMLVLLLIVALLAISCGKEKSDSGGEESAKAGEDKPSGEPSAGGETKAGPGEPTTPEPVPEPEPPKADLEITKVVVGEELTCALRADAKLLCWGLNESNALGLADLTVDAVVPQIVPTLSEVEDFWLDESNSVATMGSMYGSHSYNTICARTKGTGVVSCYGNDEGWILHGGDKPADTVAPVEVAGLAQAVDVDFGGGTSCGALADGSAACWGSNAFKALGREAADGEKVGYSGFGPGPVTGLADVVQIGLGLNRGCARTKAGELWCWGNDKLAAKVEDEGLAAPISQLSMATNDDLACVIDSASKVACGEGSWKVVEGVASAAEVAVAGQTICARDNAGAVQCWCKDTKWSFMQCEAQDKPAPVAFPEPVTQLSVGSTHGCALLASGRVACWGENRRGQLGDTTLTDRPTPVLVTGLDAESTTPPELPPGAQLPPVVWPGEGLDACAETVVTGEETFTPRTVFATPSRTVEGNWALELLMSEDLFEGKYAPRPRGRGVALELDVVAREEVQRSPNGDRIAYVTKPLTAGVYEDGKALSLESKSMNRLADITLTNAKVTLTHVDMVAGVVCGTIESGVKDSPMAVRGRFAARVDQEAIAAAALNTAPAPLELKDVPLASGDKVAAAMCDTGALPTISHAGESALKSLSGDGKRMLIEADQYRYAVLDIASNSATGCKLAPAADWGAGGAILPDSTPDSIFFDGKGEPFVAGSFGRIYTLNTMGAQEQRCEVKGPRKFAASPDGKLLLAADSSPALKLYDAATCEEKGAWGDGSLAGCEKVAFIDGKQAVAQCNKRLHLVKEGKIVFTAGSDDYSSPERLPYSADFLGVCGKSICVQDDATLQVWKLDGTFAGKVDLKEVTGATTVLDTLGDAKGLWVLAAYKRGESSSWETRVLRVGGFPGGDKAPPPGSGADPNAVVDPAAALPTDAVAAEEPAAEEPVVEPAAEEPVLEPVVEPVAVPAPEPVKDPTPAAKVERPKADPKKRDKDVVKAFCDDVMNSTTSFAGKCGPLGKRLERSLNKAKFETKGLMKDRDVAAGLVGCKRAEKAASACMTDGSVKAFFNAIK